MGRLLSSETLTVGVLIVLFAGDFWRNLISVPGWVAISLVCAAWAVAALIVNRISWRAVPTTLAVALGWIAVSPLWSPYAPSAAILTLGFALTVVTAVALATTVPIDDLFRRAALALRLILGASLVFEFAVALSGSALYPFGTNATSDTSIELAWSRGILFEWGGRIQGVVGNANLLGMLALLLFIIQIVNVTQNRTRRVAIVDVMLSSVVLALTASTTVSVAGVAVAGVWALAWFARRPRLVTRIGFSVLFVGAVGFVVFAATNWTTVAGALGKSPDMTNRFGIWEAVIGRIETSPWIGSGFVGWWPTWDPWFALHSIRDIRVQQAHNAWLDLVMQVGFVGALLFALSVIATGWMLWRHAARRSDPAAVIAIGIFTAMLVQTLTESRILSEWGIAVFVVLAIVAKRHSLASSAPH